MVVPEGKYKTVLLDGIIPATYNFGNEKSIYFKLMKHTRYKVEIYRECLLKSEENIEVKICI